MKRIYFYFIFLFIVCLNPIIRAEINNDKNEQRELMLINFKNAGEKADWMIVNDDVMGGISSSKMIYSDTGTAVFTGTVSLENNGGFASTRREAGSYNLDDYIGLLLRIKGDGQKYQLRLRTDNRWDGVSYRAHFATTADSWITVRVPFSEFVPVFRGRIMKNVPALSPANIKQIGFLIADKQAGTFRLEIEWIKAYR